MSVPKITDSSDRIAGIYYNTEGASGFTVGSHDCHMGCDKIEAYPEYGPGDFMPFYAVYRGDRIHARVPAWAVTVFYGEA